MNVQEFADKFNTRLAELYLGPGSFYSSHFHWEDEHQEISLSYKDGKALEKEFGNFEQVASNLIHEEGEGDRTYLAVFFFEKHKFFLAFDAYYNSWLDMKFSEKFFPVFQSDVNKTEYKRAVEKYGKLSGKELVLALATKLDSLSISYDKFVNYDYDEKSSDILVAVFGPHKKIYDERAGSEFDVQRIIWYYPDHDVYVGLDGDYSSYDGTDYSSAVLQEYKQVPSIEYHPV